MAAHIRSTRCPYCTAPSVVQRSASGGIDPAFVLGFVVTQQAAEQRARHWVAGTWFTPNAFKRSAFAEVRGVYVPAYLYSTAAEADYSASIGENYTVTETYTDSNGKTRTRTKTKTEWRSLTGRWAAFVDDIVVTASRGLPNDELEAVEPFDLRALRRHTPKLLSGWIAEDPTMNEQACLQLARQEANEAVARRLTQHMPGDSHRNLQFTTKLRHEDLELVLLPTWILAVRYAEDKPLVRLVINGQTGKVTGKPPRSWVKIGLAVVAVLAMIALGFLFAESFG